MSAELPLLLFVHVPKCGGTSLRHFLRMATSNGVEEARVPPELREARLSGAAWAACHAPLHKWQALAGERPLEAVALVREPASRLRSHVNMCFDLVAGPTPRPDLILQPALRSFAQALVGADPADARGLRDKIHRTGFLGVSSAARLLCRPDIDAAAGDDQLAVELGRFSHICGPERIPELCASFGFLDERELAAIPPESYRQNIGQSRFGPELFADGPLAEYLEEHQDLDRRIYRLAQELFPDPPLRRHDRRAWRDARHFNEAEYLETNPDIREAVAAGRLASGLQHYRSHGRAEQRPFPGRLDEGRTV